MKITKGFGFRLNLTFIVGAVVLLASMLFVQQSASAADEQQEPITVFLDLEPLSFDVPPQIKNGTTLVPFRAFFEALGMEVRWDPAERLVTGQNAEVMIQLTIGEKQATVNGETFALLEAAEIVKGSTLVPLRFIGEATGASVFWDPYHREISIVTLAFMEKNNLDKEQLEKAVAEQLAKLAEAEAGKDAEENQASDEDDPSAQEDNEPAKPIAPVDLNKLEGMYYGWRSDFGGYECGGMCWDFYTFLPDKKVFIGLPDNGGPETIDCNKEECLNYTISNGELKLSNGNSLPIEKSDEGFLTINDVQLDKVQPVPDGTTIDHDYVFYGYYGLIGVTGAASTYIYNLSLESDGTFELSGVTLGSVGANSGGVETQGSNSGSEKNGTYKIEGNTIMMTSNDGKNEERFLFFIHNSNPEGETIDIQIGGKNYYVKED